MKYPFKVYQTQVEDHVFWIAESRCLKGCVGQGDTIDEAICSLEENEAVWIETASECGIEIPAVPVETINGYSGKFTVRMSPAVHRAAAQFAQAESISLNQYVNDAIIAQNTRYETVDYLAVPVRNAVSELKRVYGFDAVMQEKRMPASKASITISIQMPPYQDAFSRFSHFLTGSKEEAYAFN